MTHYRSVCCALILFLWQSNVHAEGIPASLGDEPAACSASETAKLRETIRHLVNGRAPNDAWHLARVLLCGSGEPAERFIAKHAPDQIAFELHDTVANKVESSHIRRGDKLFKNGFARAHAWRATAEAKGEDIFVFFVSGETCFNAFTLRNTGPSWQLISLAAGCD
jgi:hypothetical protein